MSLPVMILAGGLAKRMRPLTETIPKALLPVADKPFIDWQLDLLHQNGIKRVVLCVGHLGGQIEEYLSQKDFDMEILFSYDGDTQLGTGGAIRKAAPLAGEVFFVLYGDSYLEIDYAGVEKSWRNSGKPALMTVFRNNNQWDMSNVQYENNEIVRYSKTERDDQMRHIDYGLGILTSGCLEGYGHIFDLADVYTNLAVKGNLAGYEAKQRFYEIGSLSGLKTLGDRLGK